MSDSPSKIFLFIERESNQLLEVKKSLRDDFKFDGKDWYCVEVRSSFGLQIKNDQNYIWTLAGGLRLVTEESSLAAENKKLLRKKVQILISMKATLNQIWKQLRPQVSSPRILTLNLRPEVMPNLLKFIGREKKFLKNRIDAFFAQVSDQVQSAQSLNEVIQIYDNIVNNVTLGGYAALSTDYEGANEQKNKS